MLVLVTRPKGLAVTTARELRALGHRCLMDPMLVIRRFPQTAPSDNSIAAVILTSANGALGVTSRLAALPTFAVGPATAAAARGRGCTDVRTGTSDGRALAVLVRESIRPEAGCVLHLAGEEVREGLQEDLEAAGYDYRRLIVYRAEPAIRLGGRTVQALTQGELDAVLFFSPRTAEIFADRVSEAGLGDMLGSCWALCMSEAVADPVRRLQWAGLRVSSQRDQRALLACLEGLGQ
jgi:uroporphyrinogen-III synthase